MRKVYLIRFKTSSLRHSRPISQEEANEELIFLSNLHPSNRDWLEGCTLSKRKAQKYVDELNADYGLTFEKFEVKKDGEESRFDYYAHCRFYYYKERYLL